MNKFDELATFVDKIHKKLKEQDYISLMEYMKNLREDIVALEPQKEQYRLNINFYLPHIALTSDNSYEIVEEGFKKEIIFDRKNILSGLGSETDFDLSACIDGYVGKPCEIRYNGKIRLDICDLALENTCFRLHCRSCDDKGNDDCDNDDCPWLAHSYYQSKLISWEKL